MFCHFVRTTFRLRKVKCMQYFIMNLLYVAYKASLRFYIPFAPCSMLYPIVLNVFWKNCLGRTIYSPSLEGKKHQYKNSGCLFRYLGQAEVNILVFRLGTKSNAFFGVEISHFSGYLNARWFLYFQAISAKTVIPYLRHSTV